MNHYPSWSKLNQQLTGLLCEQLRGRLSYFLTRYHRVHNSYGRAAIRLDHRELICFSWVEMYQQDADLYDLWKETGRWDAQDLTLKEKWDADGAYHDMDFLRAATAFLQMPIEQALADSNYLIRIFAILDRRVGKRTLRKIKEAGAYQRYPHWVKQFYDLRLGLC